MPKSLKCKIKHLCYNGTLTERERDRILKALEQEPCEDCISREEALLALTGMDLPTDRDKLIALFTERIQQMPSVTPQRAKGYWIEVNDGRCVHHFKCSECGQCVSWIGKEEHYCSNCGAYMGGGEE